MNTFGVYRVRSKTHVPVLSAEFCRRIADWSIYNTFNFEGCDMLVAVFLYDPADWSL
jgi:hypothetical protein